MEYTRVVIILCVLCWSDAKSLEETLKDILQASDVIKSQGDKQDISELKSDLKTYIDELVDRKSYRKLYSDTVVHSLMTEKKLRRQLEIKLTAIEEKRKQEISALREELVALKENNNERFEDVQSRIDINSVEIKSFHNEVDGVRRAVAMNRFRTVDVRRNAELHRSRLDGLLQYVHGELKGTLDKCGKRVEDLKTQLATDQANTNLKLNDIDETYFKTLESLIPHRVAFDAILPWGEAYEDLKPGQTLVFSKVNVNDGDGYSGITGEFIAPFTGTYMFHVHITGGDDIANEIRLVKNNDSDILNMFIKGPSFGSDSGSVVVKLRVGDVVEVQKHDHYGQRPFYVHHKYSFFSGFLGPVLLNSLRLRFA